MRGKIKHPNRARQLIDFSNLRYGNITPTDLDGTIEYQDKCWVLFEAKFGDAEMPFGQKLALRRMVDALAKTKPAVFFLGRHNTPPHEDIDAAELLVNEYYFDGEWRGCTPTKLKEMTDRFLSSFG